MRFSIIAAAALIALGLAAPAQAGWNNGLNTHNGIDSSNGLKATNGLEKPNGAGATNGMPGANGTAAPGAAGIIVEGITLPGQAGLALAL
jgi:hypothetical protein